MRIDPVGGQTPRDTQSLTGKQLNSDPTKAELKSRIVVELLQERTRENVGIVQTDIEFVLHEETGHLMVKVIDIRTGETIREIPPEEFLNMVAKISRFIGHILDERA